MSKEQYWSRFADDFEERNNYVAGKLEMEILLQKVSEQTDLKNTLELACGNGTYSKILAINSDSLIATDFSEEMVSSSKNRLKDIKNITVENENCYSLSYKDNRFDTVFMANLLHIIEAPKKTISESKRVLKQGGKIIILDFGMEGMSFINKITLLYRYIKTYGKPPAKRQTLTIKKVAKMMAELDLQVLEAHLIGNRMKALFVIAQKK